MSQDVKERPSSPVIPSSELRPPTIDTQSLFVGRSEIRLLHQGVEYRLRITKLGKLILTK